MNVSPEANGVPDISQLRTIAGNYVMREAAAKSMEEAHARQREDFGVTDAALAAFSLTTEALDFRYLTTKVITRMTRNTFVKRYNQLYPDDPVQACDAQLIARAVLELDEIHAHIRFK